MLDYRSNAIYNFGEDLHELKDVKLLVLDNDGIMTDCQVSYSDPKEPIEITYNVLDGYGLIQLKQVDVKVAIISGRKNPALEQRCDILGIPKDMLCHGVSDKYTHFKDLLARLSLNEKQVVYMGDDAIDLDIIKNISIGVTVPNCHPMLVNKARYQTTNYGGKGAVREICDLIILAKTLHKNQLETPSSLTSYQNDLVEYFFNK